MNTTKKLSPRYVAPDPSLISYEDDIPLPSARSYAIERNRAVLQPLKVSQSFFLPDASNINQIKSALSRAAKLLNYKIQVGRAASKGKQGVRVWRVK